MLHPGMAALLRVGSGLIVAGAASQSLRADRRRRVPGRGIGGVAAGLLPAQNSQPRSSSARAPQTMQVVRSRRVTSGDSRRGAIVLRPLVSRSRTPEPRQVLRGPLCARSRTCYCVVASQWKALKTQASSDRWTE